MDISCSPLSLIAPRFPAQGTADIVDAGFQNISLDISLCCVPEELKRCGKVSPNYASPDPWTVRIMEDPVAL